MSHFYGKLNDVFYFNFGANDTSGSGDDGVAPAADVRLAGAGQGDAPVHSPVPILLTHANYPAGCYEITITASNANGYANGSPNHYSVYHTLAVDSQNPTGFVGSFELSANGGIALRGTDNDTLKNISDELDVVDTVVDAIKAITDILVIKKNTELANLPIVMRLTSDHVTEGTGKVVTIQRSIDGGAFANAANTPAVEISDGAYKITLSAADLNAIQVVLIKATAPDCDTVLKTLIVGP